MKKIFFLLTIISFLISCNNEEINQKEGFLNSKEIENYAKMHSSGLEFCIDKFKSSNLNNELFRTSNNQIDTLALINFFEEETRNYLANNPVIYNGKAIDLNILNQINISDSDKIKTVSHSNFSYDWYTNNEINLFFKDFIQDISSKSTINEINSTISIYSNSAEIKFSKKEDLDIVLSFINITKDSVNHWYKKSNNTASRGWFALAIADAYGAFTWGSFGMAAGPAGAIIVGLNGAIIDSAVAYALGLAP